MYSLVSLHSYVHLGLELAWPLLRCFDELLLLPAVEWSSLTLALTFLLLETQASYQLSQTSLLGFQLQRWNTLLLYFCIHTRESSTPRLSTSNVTIIFNHNCEHFKFVMSASLDLTVWDASHPLMGPTSSPSLMSMLEWSWFWFRR